MSDLRAILSYARLPQSGLAKLKKGLDELGIQIKWIAAHDKEQDKSKKLFPEAKQVRWASYRFNETWSSHFDKNLFDTLFRTDKITALPIVERYYPFEGGSLEAEIRLAHDFSIAHHMIKDCQPEMILFGKTPESGIDYCLYLIAKYLNITTIFTKGGAFPHSRVISTDIDSPILDKYWRTSNAIVPICNLKNPGKEISSITLKRIREIQNSEKNSIPDYMRNQGVYAKNQDNRLIQFNPKYPYTKLFRHYFKKGSGMYYKKQLLKKNERISTPLDEINFSKRTYYFPLHYQPELTSMPLGKEFVNQLKIIKLISQYLSSDEQLLVKDHPSTFATITKTNSNFRTKSFYDWIQKIPNVKLVSVYVSSNYLMDKSRGLVTITGTAGMEAMIRNKTVLSFGNASYLNGPGIFRINTENDISKALEMIPVSYDYREVEKFMMALDGTANHLEFSPDEFNNAQYITQMHYVTTLLEGLKKMKF